MKVHDVFWGVLFIAFGTWVIVVASSFPDMPGQIVGPKTLPSFLGAGFVVGGVVLGFKCIGKQRVFVNLNSGWLEGRRVFTFLVAILGSLFYALWFETIGFVIGGVILMSACLWLEGHRSLLWIGFSLVFVACIYYVLANQLRVPLPSGYLG